MQGAVYFAQLNSWKFTFFLIYLRYTVPIELIFKSIDNFPINSILKLTDYFSTVLFSSRRIRLMEAL